MKRKSLKNRVIITSEIKNGDVKMPKYKITIHTHTFEVWATDVDSAMEEAIDCININRIDIEEISKENGVTEKGKAINPGLFTLRSE